MVKSFKCVNMKNPQELHFFKTIEENILLELALKIKEIQLSGMPRDENRKGPGTLEKYQPVTLILKKSGFRYW
ncbi:hypothetical protein ACFL5V_00105 [Fibrobacterota bacterium]